MERPQQKGWLGRGNRLANSIGWFSETWNVVTGLVREPVSKAGQHLLAQRRFGEKERKRRPLPARPDAAPGGPCGIRGLTCGEPPRLTRTEALRGHTLRALRYGFLPRHPPAD